MVGGGLAGAETCRALRAQGYDGSLVLVCGENHLPYDRPPLSKAALLGDAEPTTLEIDYDALGVELLLFHRATRLGDGVLETVGGGAIDFEALVVATGSAPVVLPGVVPGVGGVHVLRTVEDAVALRAALVPGARVVVVGAGWVGAEVTTAARARGCAVTVVEAAPAPLAGALGESVGSLTIGWYAEAGAELLLGEKVTAVEPGAVRLASGAVLPADVVVLGLGVRPDTGWLADSGLARVGRAITVDARLRTSRPDVYAVGDCAVSPSRRFGVDLHVEHWDNALRAPAVVAANLLGGSVEWDPVPYFWSEQFGRYLQFVGWRTPDAEVVRRGDGSVCWLRGDQLVAVLAIDRPHDATQGRRLIASGASVDPALLADPAVALRSAAR